MNKNEINNLEKVLKVFNQKKINVNQIGFIESEYSIEQLKYFIEYDILNIIDGKSENYLKININQIYKIEYNKENENTRIRIYMDNDIEIVLN